MTILSRPSVKRLRGLAAGVADFVIAPSAARLRALLTDDSIVTEDFDQTLKNKSLDGADNTFSNIPFTALHGSELTASTLASRTDVLPVVTGGLTKTVPIAVVRGGFVTPQDFEGKGDDATNDTPAWQAAVNDGGGAVLGGKASYRMVPSATSPHYFGNQTGTETHPAILASGSDLTLGRFGTVLHAVGRPGELAGVAEEQPCFSTLKNMSVTGQRNITFDGLEVNVENDTDSTNSNQRGPYCTGVTGLRFWGTTGRSRGNRRGYFTHIQNCDQIAIVGHRHEKMTGGVNMRFTYGSVWAANTFVDFSEAIDYDGASWNAAGAGFVFKAQRTSQAMDLNSLQRGAFACVVGESVGNVVTVSYKKTTPPNFSDYVNNVTPTSLTPTADIALRDFKFKGVGDASHNALIIGNDWGSYSGGVYSGSDHVGYDPVHDIHADGWVLDDTTIVYVYEGKRIKLSNFTMRGVTVPVGLAAIYCQSFTANPGQIEWSDLDISLEDVVIEGADRGGVRIGSASRVRINGLRTSGLDTLATGAADLALLSLEARGTDAYVDRLDLEGNVQIGGSSTAVPPWTASTSYEKGKVVNNGGLFYRAKNSGTSAGSGGPTGRTAAIVDNTITWRWEPQPFRVIWGPHNRVRGTIVFTGDAHKFVHGRNLSVSLGDVAATGTRDWIAYVAQRRCLISSVTFSTFNAATADAVNYRSLVTKSVKAGVVATVASANSILGWAGNSPIDGGFAASEPDAYLDPGDVLYIESAHAGTGKALTGLVASLQVLDL